MLSISPGMSAGQAGGYFSREDYYLRDAELGSNSRWCGEGARALGLEGPVREEDFRALCRGEDPAGNRIVAPRLSRDRESGELIESHRAGNDCTFSAPKSVSIAYVAGVKGIKEAHDAAVVSVLSHLEAHYCHYRSPEGVVNGGMAAAKFDHATSRNVDPQLHSHVFLVNAVKASHGGWKANEPRAIFQDQKSLGLLYRQELARELGERGFTIEVSDRSQMYFELKGIDPGLTEHFSSRREAIERQVELWRSEGRFTEVPHARLYEMAALETRDPKRAVTREEVARIFERGFELCGTSTERVRLELERGRDLKPPPPGGSSPASVVELAARELTEREAVLDRARLLDQAVRISGGGHGVWELNRAIDAGEGVLRLGQDARGREYYTTPEMLELESRNLARIRELAPFRSAVAAPELESFLERARLTAGQKAEVFNELAGGRGLALTVGDPGTAKTSTLQVIERFNEEVLRPRGVEHCSLNLAYTGKAARELGLATSRPAFTLDSFRSACPASKFALQRANGEPLMVEVAGERVLIPEGGQGQLVIRVDEAGFLGARQAEHLLGVVEELKGMGMQVKLHLLGDSKQMQGILAGDLLRQVEELGVRREVDYAHLDEILRQRDPGLLKIARELNRGDRSPGENAREALLALERRGALVEIGEPQELKSAVVRHYLEESGKPSPVPERAQAGERQQVLLVTGTNAQRKELNREIRAARIEAGEIGEGKRFPVLVPVPQGVTVEGYQLGDTVLFSGSRREDGRMERWGARLNTEAKVTALNREGNRVQVSYSFHTRKKDGRELARTVTREFSAAEMAGKTALYREEERNLSVGDRIVALKNDARLDLQNGTLGVIRELNDQGRALLDLGGRTVALDLKKYRQLDHAYAVTIHKSQGATVEHCIMYAPVRPGPGREPELSGDSFGRTSYNALNVAVTRARFEARVFTNSVEGLTRAVQTVEVKSSTLNRLPGRERESAAEPPGKGRLRELDAKMDELERIVRGKGVRLGPEPKLAAGLPSPGPQLPRPAAVSKEVGKQLELTLPKKFGLGMER